MNEGDQCTNERYICFFFNDTATTEIYTLSLHDALPIYAPTTPRRHGLDRRAGTPARITETAGDATARRARRHAPRGAAEIGRAHGLNSSHANISYAVFCLKKKN